MLGLGLALTNFGTKGGISDAADGGTSAAALFLATHGPGGMAIDFTDQSIAIVWDAEAFLGEYGPTGMVIDFVDQEIAIGTV